MKTKGKLPNIHPGEVLVEEFLKPLGISQYRLGVAVGMPHSRISEIIKQRRGITTDTALRFARGFGTTPDFWLDLQHLYDIEEAKRANEDIYSAIPLLVSLRCQQTCDS